MKSYPVKFESFQRKIVQMGALQKLQDPIQTLTIFWPVYPIHTNSIFKWYLKSYHFAISSSKYF